MKYSPIMWAGVLAVYHRGSALRSQTVAESERQLSLPLCPLSSRYLSRRRRGGKKKQQNQRDKLHPPTNVWTNVKVGQRGNFGIISTATMLFSVKGDVQQGQPLM